MISMLASSAVDHVLNPRSGQNKDYEIGISCFSSKHVVLRKKSRLVLCKSGATCISADCCFSELALKKFN